MNLLLLLTMLGADVEMVDAAKVDSRWVIDIKYATTDNFTGEVLYPVGRCLLRPMAAEMLVKAQSYLDEHHAGHVFVIKDCYRPVHVQRTMWEVVKDTPMRAYVANPNTKTGSIHNYGAAVDLTLASSDGREVDMGTMYDHFGALAEPRHEKRFLKEGKLSAKQVESRRILRDAMVKGGAFKMIRNEWWHFNALSSREIRKRFDKLDIPLDVVLEAAHDDPAAN